MHPIQTIHRDIKRRRFLQIFATFHFSIKKSSETGYENLFNKTNQTSYEQFFANCN